MRRACWLAGLLVVSLSGCGRPPAMDHLKPSVFAPKELYPGGTGVLQVLIANDGDEPLQISDIDLEKTLLAGAEVIDIKPRPNGPVLELRSYRVYRMQLDVAGQSMQTVEFTLRAGDRPGTWTGDVDVGLDNFHTVTAPATLVVLPFHGQAVAPAPAPAVVAPATSS
ncbi:MAG: hypothetical protein HUU35_04095, partial [Armatimonadetes bacterium]|nr:hypothetical protein [Armatimonadota bacterium]